MRPEFGAERWFSRGHSALTRPRSWKVTRSETEPRSGPTAMCSGVPPSASDAISATTAISSRSASIGDDVTIKNFTAIWEGVTIENGAFIGPGVTFTNDIYPRSPRMKHAENRYRGREWLAKTVVGEGATLGAGSVVVAGLTIGAHAFVGAGAVVTHDVPSFALVVGNPARVRGWVCACGSRLEFVQTSTNVRIVRHGIPPNGNRGGNRLNLRGGRTRDIEPGHPSLTGTGAGSWREHPRRGHAPREQSVSPG